MIKNHSIEITDEDEADEAMDAYEALLEYAKVMIEMVEQRDSEYGKHDGVVIPLEYEEGVTILIKKMYFKEKPH